MRGKMNSGHGPLPERRAFVAPRARTDESPPPGGRAASGSAPRAGREERGATWFDWWDQMARRLVPGREERPLQYRRRPLSGTAKIGFRGTEPTREPHHKSRQGIATPPTIGPALASPDISDTRKPEHGERNRCDLSRMPWLRFHGGQHGRRRPEADTTPKEHLFTGTTQPVSICWEAAVPGRISPRPMAKPLPCAGFPPFPGGSAPRASGDGIRAHRSSRGANQ